MGNNDGAGHIVNTWRIYFAPDTAGPIYQEVARFLQFRRTDQPTDRYTVEFDLLRCKAEPKMQMGAGFPETFVFVLRMQDAAPSRLEKSLASASTQRSLIFEDVAMTMRRLFGSRGGAARQDILVEEDVEASLESMRTEEREQRTARRRNRGRGRKKGMDSRSGAASR